jgi:thiol:disulfide interchange protein DsbC
MKTTARAFFVFGLFCMMGSPSMAQDVDTKDRSVDRQDRHRDAITTTAESPEDDRIVAKITEAFGALNRDFVVEYIGPAPAPGYREVIVNGQVVYVTNDGNYLLSGMMDLNTKRDLSQYGALPGRRLKALSEAPASERIVFAPTGPTKHTVTVFTDVECGFCRKLHQDIAEYNRLGIAIEYLAYPRAGLDSADAAVMQSVWCSSDRRKALTDAKSGVEIASLQCENPVAKHHAIGQRVGLQGTPMIITTDGIALPGYMTPDQLLQSLDALAKQRNIAAPEPANSMASND